MRFFLFSEYVFGVLFTKSCITQQGKKIETCDLKI